MVANERHEVEIEGYMMLHRFLSRSICSDLCSRTSLSCSKDFEDEIQSGGSGVIMLGDR
jgi:hypothetical protein